MHEGATIAAGRRASFIGVAAVAGVMSALSVASVSHAQRAEPPAAGREAIPPNEPEAIKWILDRMEEAVNKEYAAGNRPAWRDAHAKAHGCVKADFKVKADIPAELRRGVFAAPRSFTAWIRFSNGHGKPPDDRIRDGRGMS